MKIKSLILSAVVLTACTVFAPVAWADDSAKVYVTICDDKGSLAIAQEEVIVTDIDNDGVLTINDALYHAHEKKYSGGASSGYSTAKTEYGVGITKLWGVENGSGYGYYVNNKAAMSLGDTISTGDYINAFVYTDTVMFSDTYSFFNANNLDVSAGEAFTLTLSADTYDENWNPVVKPISGARITIDGVKSEYTTDENGKVTITIDNAKSFIISAFSDDEIIVPPVCFVNVLEVSSTTQTTQATQELQEKSPQTGIGSLNLLVTVSAVSIVGIGIATLKRRED